MGTAVELTDKRSDILVSVHVFCELLCRLAEKVTGGPIAPESVGATPLINCGVTAFVAFAVLCPLRPRVESLRAFGDRTHEMAFIQMSGRMTGQRFVRLKRRQTVRPSAQVWPLIRVDSPRVFPQISHTFECLSAIHFIANHLQFNSRRLQCPVGID